MKTVLWGVTGFRCEGRQYGTQPVVSIRRFMFYQAKQRVFIVFIIFPFVLSLRLKF